MVTKKPTDLKSTGIKSVSLDQVNDLEGKTVVGGGAPTESASSTDRDLKKLDKVETKVERDDSGPVSPSRDKDSDAARKDSSKRVDAGLRPYSP